MIARQAALVSLLLASPCVVACPFGAGNNNNGLDTDANHLPDGHPGITSSPNLRRRLGGLPSLRDNPVAADQMSRILQQRREERRSFITEGASPTKCIRTSSRTSTSSSTAWETSQRRGIGVISSVASSALLRMTLWIFITILPIPSSPRCRWMYRLEHGTRPDWCRQCRSGNHLVRRSRRMSSQGTLRHRVRSRR